MFTDGWTAIVRAEPYGISWIDRAGKVVSRMVIPSQPIAATPEEMQFAIRNEWPLMPPPRPRVDEYIGWPTHVPPFLNDAVIPLEDGRIAVERTITVKSTTREYDVIDRTSRVVMILSMPLDYRIVGFGREAVFSVREVEDGVFRLGRHALPADLRR
jgi:hypothetical protein